MFRLWKWSNIVFLIQIITMPVVYYLTDKNTIVALAFAFLVPIMILTFFMSTEEAATINASPIITFWIYFSLFQTMSHRELLAEPSKLVAIIGVITILSIILRMFFDLAVEQSRKRGSSDPRWAIYLSILPFGLNTIIGGLPLLLLRQKIRWELKNQKG